ncbi:MAG: SUF system NifU family Fe-S cluster assembly protein [Proteobacteria bacterium]|nr:SUF system NifU family Fe-S cluster assembly protein [Pseudomonadota bacterium]
MDDLRELYQTTILDHNKRPRNFGPLEGATRTADGHNPLCGDKLKVYVALESDGSVGDVSFEGEGCAISTASASMMTEAARGKPREEVQATLERFHGLVTSDPTTDPNLEGLGKLAVFAGVREYPMRVKCATLAWHTLQAALDGQTDPVKTE